MVLKVVSPQWQQEFLKVTVDAGRFQSVFAPAPPPKPHMLPHWGPHVSGCMCPRTDFCNSAQEVSGSRKTGPPGHTKEAPVTERVRGGAVDHHSIPGRPLPPTVSGSQPRRRIHTTAAAVARQEAAKWHRRLLRKCT